MNTARYLERIGLAQNKLIPTLENLRLLQRRHLLNVPFENLDIHKGWPIILDLNRFYQKIVGAGRGGFCYELNGLFNELLRQIGYRTKIISARVSNGRGGFGKEYDHLAILAETDEGEFLSDVGFGDFTAGPLKFVLDLEQEDPTGNYRIRNHTNGCFEVSKKQEDVWQSEYIFRATERELAEFAGMCRFHQSPESHFFKGKVCTLLTNSGRKTLTDKKFKVVSDGQKKETKVTTEDEFMEILEKEFGIKL